MSIFPDVLLLRFNFNLINNVIYLLIVTGGGCDMEKENAPASADREKDRPTPNLLDAASLFGSKRNNIVYLIYLSVNILRFI